MDGKGKGGARRVVKGEFGGNCPGGLGVTGGGGGECREPTRQGVEDARDDSVASNDSNAGFAGNAITTGGDGVAFDAPVDASPGRGWRDWGRAGEPA